MNRRMSFEPEHKIYGLILKDNQPNKNNSFNSCVENTLTVDCFLNLFSLDQMGMESLRANAKYEASFGCSGNRLFASERNLSYSDFGITFTTSHRSIKEVVNSSSSIPQNSQILSLSDRISSNKKSGANNLTLITVQQLNKIPCKRFGFKERE